MGESGLNVQIRMNVRTTRIPMILGMITILGLSSLVILAPSVRNMRNDSLRHKASNLVRSFMHRMQNISRASNRFVGSLSRAQKNATKKHHEIAAHLDLLLQITTAPPQQQASFSATRHERLTTIAANRSLDEPNQIITIPQPTSAHVSSHQAAKINKHLDSNTVPAGAENNDNSKSNAHVHDNITDTSPAGTHTKSDHSTHKKEVRHQQQQRQNSLSFPHNKDKNTTSAANQSFVIPLTWESKCSLQAEGRPWPMYRVADDSLGVHADFPWGSRSGLDDPEFTDKFRFFLYEEGPFNMSDSEDCFRQKWGLPPRGSERPFEGLDMKMSHENRMYLLEVCVCV